MNAKAGFMGEAMAAGLTHYCEHPKGQIDLLVDSPKPCRGCGHPLFSRWIFAEDYGEDVEIWTAIALGFEEMPNDAMTAEPGWLCEHCRITLDSGWPSS